MKAIVNKAVFEANSTDQHLMIGRQPIYNSHMGVYAYELLFRSPNKNIKSIDENKATAQVISSTLLSFGLDNLVGTSKAVINITAKFLKEIENLHLSPDRIILDISDAVAHDLFYLEQIRQLSLAGFTISIESTHYHNSLESILEIANIVRVDVQTTEKNKVADIVNYFSEFEHLKLLALKVETLEEFSRYRDMGFDYCQGYFLSKPRVYATKDIQSNKLAVLSLISLVNNPQSEISAIAEAINHDVSLSFKLLKLINSPFYGIGKKIESIQHALVLLGKKELRSWISLIALSNLGNKPIAMMEIAMIRARMCELLAKKSNWQADPYFTVGMFSALDLLLDTPLPNLLATLPLSDTIKVAILKKEGIMGAALQCALAYENSEWEHVEFNKLSNNELSNAYMESIEWVNGFIQLL